MKVLVTGGTVFVSRYCTEYFVRQGHEVYVLNRNTRPQSSGVKLIECDRHCIGDRLKNIISMSSWILPDITSETCLTWFRRWEDMEDIFSSVPARYIRKRRRSRSGKASHAA